MHTLVVGVLKHVDNLRSAVAKNALLTIGDMCQGLQRRMDCEVSLVVPTVLKRFGDSSVFLVDRLVGLNHISCTPIIPIVPLFNPPFILLRDSSVFLVDRLV